MRRMLILVLLQTYDKIVACHAVLCACLITQRVSGLRLLGTGRCGEGVGSRKERFLSLVPRPSSLIDTNILARLALPVW